MQVYPGPELLGHDSLQLEADLVPSLLSEEEVEELVAVYLDTMATNYEVWMGNTIRQEQEDWVGDLEPETDVDNCYYTSTPVLVPTAATMSAHASPASSSRCSAKVASFSSTSVTNLGHSS